MTRWLVVLALVGAGCSSVHEVMDSADARGPRRLMPDGGSGADTTPEQDQGGSMDTASRDTAGTDTLPLPDLGPGDVAEDGPRDGASGQDTADMSTTDQAPSDGPPADVAPPAMTLVEDFATCGEVSPGGLCLVDPDVWETQGNVLVDPDAGSAQLSTASFARYADIMSLASGWPLSEGPGFTVTVRFPSGLCHQAELGLAHDEGPSTLAFRQSTNTASCSQGQPDSVPGYQLVVMGGRGREVFELGTGSGGISVLSARVVDASTVAWSVELLNSMHETVLSYEGAVTLAYPITDNSPAVFSAYLVNNSDETRRLYLEHVEVTDRP